MAIKSTTLAGSFCWIGMVVVVLGVGGCSGSSVDTYEVSGTITYKDQPVANVAVTFNPVDDGLAATGVTDAQGKFKSLSTQDSGDGVAAGSYIITLSQAADVSTDLVETAEAYDEPAATDLPFPTKYLNTAESDLKATVDGDKELTFTLTD
ncbi:MAG: carboxypeptidase regulatory-like domain-containing protein [Planctomycetes bacterium]|nr:carboxypeptidase regulatory-like domain-containing protein [Planctomycetota bacterium]